MENDPGFAEDPKETWLDRQIKLAQRNLKDRHPSIRSPFISDEGHGG